MKKLKRLSRISTIKQPEFKNISPVKGMSISIRSSVCKKNSLNFKKQSHLELPTLYVKSLDVSDYKDFLNFSKKKGKCDYPSVFKQITIKTCHDTNIKNLKLENVCALNFTRRQLVKIASQYINKNEFCNTHFGEDKIQQLLLKIAEAYNPVSYHNFTHGFNLMQLLYKCIEADTSLKQLLSSQEITIYLVSALAHDMGHPGTNNSFELKTKSQLAIQASRDSVLEKMHIQKFLSLMRQNPSLSLLKKSEDPLWMKKIITEGILSTDIAKHFPNLKILKEQITVDVKMKQSEKRFVMGQLIHACDIGNPTLQFEEYFNWAALLSYEFNEQAKIQEQRGLKPDAFLFYNSILTFYQGQVGFVSALVLPLWRQISVKFPATSPMVKNIQKNIQKIKQLKDMEHI